MAKITRQITLNQQPLTFVIVNAVKTNNNQLIIDINNINNYVIKKWD